MIPSKVSFTGFDVENPHNVLRSQGQNKAPYWPIDWTLVLASEKSDLSEVNIFQWFKNNCCHRWDRDYDGLGRQVFAFEDEGEATLFMLRF
jgi:hypothetical protein